MATWAWMNGRRLGYVRGEGSWILEDNLEMIRAIERMGGIDIGRPKLNLPKMMAHKDATVASNVGGVAFLFKKNKIDTFRGTGRIAGNAQESTNAVGAKSPDWLRQAVFYEIFPRNFSAAGDLTFGRQQRERQITGGGPGGVDRMLCAAGLFRCVVVFERQGVAFEVDRQVALAGAA